MRVVGADEAPARRAPGGLGLRTRVLAGPAPRPAAEVGMVEVEVAPGAGLPTHAHGDAEAVVYVVAGRARFSGPDGEEEVAGGSAVHVPRGEPVAVANAGADTLRVIAVFSPAGFERRFLDWDESPPEAPEPEARLDLTALPRAQRHATVVAALEALRPGTRLVVLNDHEPVGLQQQLERRYEGRLGWDVRERTADRVAVGIWLDGPAPDEARRDAVRVGMPSRSGA